MEALDLLDVGIDKLVAEGFDPLDDADAVMRVEAIERRLRRLQAAAVDQLAGIDRTKTFRADGHRTAGTMVRHVARLSGGEARRRRQLADVMAALPELADGLRAGEVSICAVQRVARAWANPRIRDGLAVVEDRLVVEAKRLSYRRFDWFVTDLETLLDQDGARDRNDHNHHHRDVTMVQNYDKSWSLQGHWAALAGARINDIFQSFIDTETTADWAAARDQHGEEATASDLERTPQQRRADAFAAMCEHAAATPEGGKAGGVVTNIVIDHKTFQSILLLLATAKAGEAADVDSYRCSTVDGHPLEPTEAVTAAICGEFRRIVTGPDSTVIDMGRRTRFFTGSARLAAQLASPECVWPGCHVPTTRCEIDHLQPWHQSGRTSPDNGAPLCGRHNRWKQTGHTITRDPTGQWHTHRPNHTEI